jgi:hypothetical protein
VEQRLEVFALLQAHAVAGVAVDASDGVPQVPATVGGSLIKRSGADEAAIKLLDFFRRVCLVNA